MTKVSYEAENPHLKIFILISSLHKGSNTSGRWTLFINLIPYHQFAIFIPVVLTCVSHYVNSWVTEICMQYPLPPYTLL